MPKAKEIGARIAHARRLKGLRDEADVRPVDLARAVGVSGASVSDWEAGKVTPREELLAKVADYLDVTPAWLRYGIEEATMVTPDPALDRRITPTERRAAKALVEQQPKRKPDGPRKRGAGGA